MAPGGWAFRGLGFKTTRVRGTQGLRLRTCFAKTGLNSLTMTSDPGLREAELTMPVNLRRVLSEPPRAGLRSLIRYAYHDSPTLFTGSPTSFLLLTLQVLHCLTRGLKFESRFGICKAKGRHVSAGGTRPETIKILTGSERICMNF